MSLQSINGQILPGSLPGNEIEKIVKREDVKIIVESGTWEGGGTTLCVLKNLKNDQRFFSVELYPDVYEKAKNNLKDYSKLENFILLNGAFIDFKDIFYFDHLKEIDFITDAHAKLWYVKDLQHLKNSKNILPDIPDHIDFLILDGGEWSTYPEWEKLRDRTRIIFLDDTRVFKTKQIRNEIISSNQYNTIADYTMDTRYRGFAIFEKLV